MRLPVPPHFSFVSTVESHGWYLLAPFRWDRRSRILRRAETLPAATADLEIRVPGSTVEVRGGPACEELATRIRRMLQLSVDTSEFLVLAAGSQTHRWVGESGFGRLLCGTTLFEDIVKVIATTNTTWVQTVRMVRLLVEKCGGRSASGFAAFPSPDEIARFTVEDLQQDCRLGYRARTIHALAEGIVSGSIDLAAVCDPAQTTEGLFSSYRTLPGIGPYGAAHLLAMDGRHDFIAVDTEFRRFVRERYHGGRPVSEKTMLRHYAKWGRWKYLAYWSELWNSVADRLQPDDPAAK